MTFRPRVSAPLEAAAVAGTLGLAALLRFAFLPSRGLIYWDEAKFSLEGVRLLAALESLRGVQGHIVAGKTIGTAKPTHALFIALGMAVWGVHDYTPLLVNAITSVADVFLTFLIGRRLFGPFVGYLGALLLAVSEYEVIYARSALSESDGSALLLCGFLIYVTAVWPTRTEGGRTNGRLLRIFAAGCMLGLAFTTNYRLIVYIGSVLAVDLGWLFLRCAWREAVPRASVWAFGLAIAPAAWQAVDAVARTGGLILFRNELTGAKAWYLQQALYQLHEGKQSVIHISPLPYAQWFLVRQGWPVAFLVLVGLGLAAWRRSFPWLAVALPAFLSYFVFVFAPFVVPRNLEAALPFTSLLAAAALGTVLDALQPERLRYALTLGLPIVLALSASAITWRLTEVRSGFAASARFVEQHGGRALTTTELMIFYLRGSGETCLSPAMPRKVPDLGPFVRSGYRYAVLDRRHGGDASHFVPLHEILVRRFLAAGSPDIGENLIASENSSPPGSTGKHEYVEVYALRSMLGRLSPEGRPWTCDRDLVT